MTPLTITAAMVEATRNPSVFTASRDGFEINWLAVEAFAHFPSARIMSQNALARARLAAWSISGDGQSSFENSVVAPEF